MYDVYVADTLLVVARCRCYAGDPRTPVQRSTWSKVGGNRCVLMHDQQQTFDGCGSCYCGFVLSLSCRCCIHGAVGYRRSARLDISDFLSADCAMHGALQSCTAWHWANLAVALLAYRKPVMYSHNRITMPTMPCTLCTLCLSDDITQRVTHFQGTIWILLRTPIWCHKTLLQQKIPRTTKPTLLYERLRSCNSCIVCYIGCNLLHVKCLEQFSSLIAAHFQCHIYCLW